MNAITCSPCGYCVSCKENEARKNEVELLRRELQFNEGTIPLPKVLVLEHARLDIMWQSLVAGKTKAEHRIIQLEEQCEATEKASVALFNAVTSAIIRLENPDMGNTYVQKVVEALKTAQRRYVEGKHANNASGKEASGEL